MINLSILTNVTLVTGQHDLCLSVITHRLVCVCSFNEGHVTSHCSRVTTKHSQLPLTRLRTASADMVHVGAIYTQTNLDHTSRRAKREIRRCYELCWETTCSPPSSNALSRNSRHSPSILPSATTHLPRS